MISGSNSLIPTSPNASLISTPHSLTSNAAPVLQLNFHIHEDPGSGSQTPYDFQATREKIRLNAKLPFLYVISVV
ncbi:hypothetical protein PS1_033247 [Malus domestica]